MKLYQVQNNQREKNVDAMFFCSLQVSNRFARTASPMEQQMNQWMIDHLDHRTLHGGADALSEVVKVIVCQVESINRIEQDPDRKLVVSVQPLAQEHTGYIRIERQGGRHQSVLLPIIDTKGSVQIFEKGGAL